jgi:hypothetical protein
LALELAESFIRNKLQALAMTHLDVQIRSRSLIIYSMERNVEGIRAMLTHTPGNEFALSIADHRGEWQLIPFAGLLPDVMNLLTEELVFALARWPDYRSVGAYTYS